jgi:hypothetical protein
MDDQGGLPRAEKARYLRQGRESTMAGCDPFFWSSQEAGQPPRLLHNGPICYVDNGQCQIGITNNDQQYIDDPGEFPWAAQFNGNTLKPETRLIDRNKHLDLATVGVPQSLSVRAHAICITEGQGEAYGARDQNDTAASAFVLLVWAASRQEAWSQTRDDARRQSTESAVCDALMSCDVLCDITPQKDRDRSSFTVIYDDRAKRAKTCLTH